MNYKGKKGTFTVEKSGGHQVIKVNLTISETSTYYVPPDMIHYKERTLMQFSCPKTSIRI